MRTTFILLLGAALVPMSSGAATIGTWDPAAAPELDGWLVTTVGSAGSFAGDPASNGFGAASPLPNPAWGFWSDGGSSSGVWNLDGGELEVGQSITVGFDNGGVTAGNSVSLGFGEAGTVGINWSFTGGDANYAVTDSLGDTDSGQAWTSEGMFVTLTLTSAATYKLDVSGNVTYSTTGVLANGLDSIDQLTFLNDNSSGGGFNDAFVGGITVVPEPSAALLGGLGLMVLLRRRR